MDNSWALSLGSSFLKRLLLGRIPLGVGPTSFLVAKAQLGNQIVDVSPFEANAKGTVNPVYEQRPSPAICVVAVFGRGFSI